MNPKIPATVTDEYRYVRVTLNLPSDVARAMAELPSGNRSSFAAETLRIALKKEKLRSAIESINMGPRIHIVRKPTKWRKKASW